MATLARGLASPRVIAHRLTTLKDCNRILVFDQGRVAEEGSYDELVQRGGIFTALVESAEGGLFHPVSPSEQGMHVSSECSPSD